MLLCDYGRARTSVDLASIMLRSRKQNKINIYRYVRQNFNFTYNQDMMVTATKIADRCRYDDAIIIDNVRKDASRYYFQ